MRGLLYSFPVRLTVILGAVVAAAVIVAARGAFDVIREEVRARF